jgi:acetyl-CoA carboxylase biotin carboxyl carrier protein
MTSPQGGDHSTPGWAEVLDLVRSLEETGLADADITMGDIRVRVSRTQLAPEGEPARSSIPVPSVDEPVEPAAGSGGEPSGTPAEGTAITAPMLGVVYLRPAPDAEPFVQVGDVVGPETTVAIVEVMKMMNPVTAETDGTISTVAVTEGQTVEYGDVLFRLAAT